MKLRGEERGQSFFHGRQGREEIVDGGFEVGERCVEFVVDDAFLEQQPAPFHQIEIGRTGRQLDQFQARVGGEKSPHIRPVIARRPCVCNVALSGGESPPM